MLPRIQRLLRNRRNTYQILSLCSLIFGLQSHAAPFKAKLGCGALLSSAGEQSEQWPDDGTIFLDYSPSHEAVVQKAIAESKVRNASLISDALVYETRFWKMRVGSDCNCETVETYIAQLNAHEFMPNLTDRERTQLIEIISRRLVNHWHRAKFMVNAKYVQSWDEYATLQGKNRLDTPRNSVAVFEALKIEKAEGRGIDGGQAIVERRDLEDPELATYFYSGLLTHTALPQQAMKIAETGFVQSPWGGRNNFAASAVVVKRNAENESVTYVFDLKDLVAAIPIDFGLSNDIGENELSSYYPIDIRLARAVVPTKVFWKQATRTLPSSGWIAKPIDAAAIKKISN